MSVGKPDNHDRPGIDVIPDKWLQEDVSELKKTILLMTCELVGSCAYCIMISSNPEFNTPISCAKFLRSGEPMWVDVETCISCGEYRK